MFRKKKTLKKGQLSNIEVDLVSILFDDMKPANRKGAVVKCETGSYGFKGSSEKYKSDDQGRVFVTVMEPGVADSQGDIADEKEILKACERFSQSGMVRKNDVNHDLQPVDECFIAENYILKSEDKEHFPDTKIGSWVQVIKFKDTGSELWKKVKAGKFNGVSLYGRAEDTGNQSFEKAKAEILKAIETLKAKNDDKMEPAIKELEKQIKELEEKAKSDNSNKQIEDLQKGFDTLLVGLNKAINTQIKNETGGEEKPLEVTVGDSKVLVKSEKKELYKALANVYSGNQMNFLNDSLGQQFVDTVVDFSPDDVFSDITVAELNKDEQVDKGFIDEIVLKNTKDGAPSDQTVGEFDLDVPTEVLTGVLKLKQETVEFYRDKKGEAAFGAYVEQKLSAKIQKALKRLFFLGDRTSIDANLKGLNGVIKHMTDSDEHEELERGDNVTYFTYLSRALKTFSNDALSEMSGFSIYCSPKTLLDIQDEIASRPTALGDRFVVKNDKVYFKGMEIKPRFMADDTFIIGVSKFLILGYRTDATLKIEHSGGEWVYRWYIRVRFGTQYITGGLVKYFELVDPAPVGG